MSKKKKSYQRVLEKLRFILIEKLTTTTTDNSALEKLKDIGSLYLEIIGKITQFAVIYICHHLYQMYQIRCHEWYL